MQGEANINELFLSHFKEVFSSSNVADMESVLRYINLIIGQDINSSNCFLVQDEEIKKAVFVMGSFKALGADRFNGLFFQKFWEVVGQDISGGVKSFFELGTLENNVNNTEMVLIPDVKNPFSVHNYKPISTCNFVYKIIATFNCLL